MITRNKNIIDTYPWETIKELLILKATEDFGKKAGLDLAEAISFMGILEQGGTITEAIAETLEKGGLGSKTFWLNLQRIYDEKMSKILN